MSKHKPKRVKVPYSFFPCKVFPKRVGLLGTAALKGDMNLPKLNKDGRPIANKYCEGKMKRTLKRE